MNLFIVEDAPKTRKELANLLADEKGFAVVGEAGSVRDALVGIEATLPEVVLLDISLPDGSGVEVLKFIRQHDLKLSVVVLTSNPYDALRTKCHALGAAAVLDKLEGLEQVREALLAVSPCRPRLEVIGKLPYE
jgi:two-component system, NarL family, response regulator DevR